MASYPIPFIAPPPAANANAPLISAPIRAAVQQQAALPLLAPRIAPLNMAPQLPALSAPIAPIATPVRGLASSPNSGDSQLYRDLNTYNTLNSTGSGVDQIKNPFLRGIARAADIAGSVFAPIRGLEAALPGTNEHHNYLLGQQMGNINVDLKQQSDQASLADTQAQTQARLLANQSAPQEDADRHNLSVAQTANLQSETDSRAAAPPLTLPQMHANAVQAAITAGRDPSQDPTVQHLADQIISLQPGSNKTTPLHYETTVGPDGKPHTYGLDATGQKVADEGLHYEKPSVVNVNAGEAALDRETRQFGTPYQKSLDASNAQLEKIADARAMINGNAESQGLGVPKVLTALVGGQGTGVRITQAELTAIAHARGLTGDIEGTLSKWAGQGALTKTQQQQLTQILDDVKGRIIQKQAIASRTLDSINGAGSRDDIIQADKQARQQLGALETGDAGGSSGPQSSGMAVSMAAARGLPQNKGKTDAQIRADIQSHGHQVVP